MSYSKLTGPAYTKNGIEKQLINTLHGNHDLCCGCNDPGSHLTYLLMKHCQPTSFNKEERKEIKKWHGTLGGDTTDLEEDFGFQPGDLEKLFEEDTADDG